MSDSQDFQQLDEIDIEESISPDRLNQIKNKQQQPAQPKKKLKIFTLQIIESENKIDMNILQNQFYLLKLYQKGQLIKSNVQRRYSDFDLLFQILQREYPGYIFPAFPQKGLLSYVKTKVTVTKDEEFLKKRVKIIQRFFNQILNQENFNPYKCYEIKKFFSQDSEYEIFKQTNKQKINNSKSIVDSTWGAISNFFKMNQTSKYTTIAEQIKKQKIPFQELLTKTQQLFALINEQLEVNRDLCRFQIQNHEKCVKFIPSFPDFSKKVQDFTSLIEEIQKTLSKTELQIQCENEDYLMILKKIQLIEQMRESQQNNKKLAGMEAQFINRRNEIQFEKKQTLEKLKNDFKKIVNDVNKIQRDGSQ